MKPNKTQPTNQSVDGHINAITSPQQKVDAQKLVDLMKEATGTEPVLWGSSIIGFGNYHYKYASGREGDTPAISFAVRKQTLVLYGLFHHGQSDKSIELAQRLGVHTHGKGCLYIKSLKDLDLKVLEQMIKNAYQLRVNA